MANSILLSEKPNSLCRNTNLYYLPAGQPTYPVGRVGFLAGAISLLAVIFYPEKRQEHKRQKERITFIVCNNILPKSNHTVLLDKENAGVEYVKLNLIKEK